jgi:hypothetical protein
LILRVEIDAPVIHDLDSGKLHGSRIRRKDGVDAGVESDLAVLVVVLLLRMGAREEREKRDEVE